MNLGTMRTELQARGGSDLTTGRANAFLNDAVVEFALMYEWPWDETTVTGAAPLSVTDLGRVDSVVDTTNIRPLDRSTRPELMASDPLLTSTGSPQYWYRAGETQIKVWPVQAVTLSVVHYKAPTVLSADGDEPAIPDRYHGLVVDLAQAMVLGEDVDNAEGEGSRRASVDRRIAEVAARELPDTEQRRIVLSSWGEW